jgi:hypothetical protein
MIGTFDWRGLKCLLDRVMSPRHLVHETPLMVLSELLRERLKRVGPEEQGYACQRDCSATTE